MRVGIGYCDNPDSTAAGKQAAQEALEQAGMSAPCDFILLFATARHTASTLRDAVASVLGADVRIAGGGAVGAISNTEYGYAGDQVILAAFWLDDITLKLFVEQNLNLGEEQAGQRLGQQMAASGIDTSATIALFYNAIDHSANGVRLMMATYLLEGLEKGLGFLPELIGAGLQGDFIASPTRQWIGDSLQPNCALALAFQGNIQMDTAIMHGCQPVTGYYTVTKADHQTILEINGQPALAFITSLLGTSLALEDLPLFLILGVNNGEKWGKFDEDSYASRLCFGIDTARNGIIMFEPDMVEGTEFQIMCRSIDLSYMPPKIEELFTRLQGRKPVFATYINCAGRAAGYSGIDREDAVMLQKCIGDRVPLLGIYTGVEIAPVKGRPCGLDWTGVLSIFSVPE